MAPEQRLLKPQDKAKSIVRNTSFLTVTQFSGTIVMFLLTPFILKTVGIHDFGLWAFVSAFVAFASLLNLGLGRSAARFVAVFGEHGDVLQIRRVVSYGMLSHLVLGLLALPVVWIVGRILISHSTIAGSDVQLAENLLLLSFVVFILASVVRPLFSLLVGLERIWITSVVGLACQALYAGTAVIALVAGAGIYSLVIASLVETTAQGIAYYICGRRILGGVLANPLAIERGVLRQMLVFGGWTQVVAFAALIYRQTDALVIGTWVSVPKVGLYDVGNRIAQQTRSLPLTMLAPLLPAAAGVHAQGDERRIARMTLRASRVAGFLTFSLAGLIIGTAPLIMTVWLGRSYPDVATIAVLLTVAYAINNLTGVGTTMVAAIGKPYYEAEFAMLGALINVGVTIALAPFFGLYGVVVGTVIGVVLGAAWFLWRFHRRLSLPLWGYLGSWLSRLTAGTLVAALVARLLLAWLPDSYTDTRLWGAVTLAVLAGVYAAVLVAILWALRFFEAADLDVLRRVLPRRLRRLTSGRGAAFLFHVPGSTGAKS